MQLTIEQEKKWIFVSQVVRVVLAFIVIFLLKIPLFVKILLIILFDWRVDSFQYFGFGEKYQLAGKYYYNKTDKYADMISYFMLLIWVMFYETSSNIKVFIPFLGVVLFYRLAGVILYLDTVQGDYLVAFPNFFTECLLLISIYDYLNISYPLHKQLYKVSIVIVMLAKIYQEKLMHGGEDDNLTNTDVYDLNLNESSCS